MWLLSINGFRSGCQSATGTERIDFQHMHIHHRREMCFCWVFFFLQDRECEL